MKGDEFKLNLFGPLIFLMTFAVFVASLFLFFSKLSDNRKQAVYEKYAPETTMYVGQNKQGLAKIFKEFFPSKICTSDPQPDCKKANGDQIASLISQDLKDWSSIIFIKATSDRILYMSLPGNTYDLYVNSPEKNELLKELLAGKRDVIPWDDYTYVLAEKEIIVPVKDGDVVIGALARGIIE